MMNPAQPMIAMCRITPALTMTNAVQSGAAWPSWSSGTLRQPPDERLPRQHRAADGEAARR